MKDYLVGLLLICLLSLAVHSFLTIPTVWVDISGQCRYATYPMKEYKEMLLFDCSNAPKRYNTSYIRG